jgi:uncharacterized protein (TIGR02996 family)
MPIDYRPRMPRFEDDDKFWEISIDGTTVSSRSGRIGTDGRATAPKVLPTRAKAEQEYAKRLAEQRAKGRTQVSHDLPAEPHDPALDAQIVEDPSDAGRYLVYADWLQSQGHPRGELGALQRARTSSAVAKAELALLEAHPELAPSRFCEVARKPPRGLSEQHVCSLRWEHGFIAVARVARGTEKAAYTVRELIVELLAHPAARFLRELRIGPMGPPKSEVFSYGAVIEQLVRIRPPALRTLALVDLPAGAAELGFSDLGDVTALCGALPLLEDLHLGGRSLALGEVAMPKLRRLSISSSDAEVVASLPLLALPAIEEIAIACGEADVTPSPAFAKLLAAPWQPRRFALTRTGNTDHIVPLLANAKLVAGLESLDLSGGRLGDPGGAALIASKARFAHLDALDLSGNMLSPSMCAQIVAALPSAKVGAQRAATAAISDKELLQLCPDAGALAKARSLAKPGQWTVLARDEATYWGKCKGSEGIYEVYLQLPDLDNGCSCPSGKRPCKHAIALAVLVSSGHSFVVRAPLAGLYDRAQSSRYYAGGE